MPISCGSTREDRCPPCADRAKRLRIQQCREGWHLDTEPEHHAARARRRRRTTRTRPTTTTAIGGCGRPGAARTPRTCRGCRWRTGPSAGCSPPRTASTYRPSMFLTLTLPVLRAGHRRGRAGRPGQLRLPAGRARRAALPQAGRPVLAEPAPLRRLPGPVLRRRRGPTPARPAPARRDPGRDPPQGRPRGPGRHLPPGLVAAPTTNRSTSTSLPGVDRRSGGYVDPDTGAVLPDLGRGARRARHRPRRAPGACGAVREPGRPPGPDRRHRRGRPGGRLPVQVPDQDRSPPPTTTTTTRRRPGTAHIDRLAEEVRWLPVRADVRELAAVRRPAQGRPGRDGARATASTRRTTGPTSASAAAGCSCPASGRARPSPATRPTGPPSCGPRSRKPGSTPTTTTSSSISRHRRPLVLGAARPLPGRRAHLRRRHR